MTVIEVMTALALALTLVTAIAGGAWLVGLRVVEAVRRFDALGRTVGELRRAVDANTHALNNGLRADVREQGAQMRRMIEIHARDVVGLRQDMGQIRGRLDRLHRRPFRAETKR